MTLLVAAPKDRVVTRRKRRANLYYIGSVVLLLCWVALHGKNLLKLHVTTTTTSISTIENSYGRKNEILQSTGTPNIDFRDLNDNRGNGNKTPLLQSNTDSIVSPLQPENVQHKQLPGIFPPRTEAPQVVFDDLRFRRVCSTVYKSTLCMIVRYPFVVPVQDASVPYPKPVIDQFYNLRGALMFVDGAALEDCQLRFPLTIDYGNTSGHRYYACMEYLSNHYKDIALALFTRQRVSQTEDDWYGITIPSRKQHQQSLTRSFFKNHLIVALGASPTTSIVNCLVNTFGKCQFHDRFLYSCGGSTKKKTNNHDIAIQVVRYQPDEHKPNSTQLSRHLRHVVNGTPPLLDFLQSPLHNISQHRYHNNTDATSVTLRPLTVLVEYPIAHMQTHDMITHYPGQVQYNQEHYVRLVMNITTPAARQELEQLGFKLKHLIVFDGLPQHFPTSTGAFMEHIATTRNESSFLEHPYPEWRPDYGSNCRGPIPPNSRLTEEVHIKARQLWLTALSRAGNHRRWYAPIWEFANQFWWQEIMWSTSANPRLDCLHAFKQKTGLTCVHKYFLQAMVDGYYEEVNYKLL